MKRHLTLSSILRRKLLLCALPTLTLLSACDQLGFDSPEKIAAAKEADGKAVGAGCRQTGRPIEDCYSMNSKASKAAIFAGWREMDEYMRDNKLGVVAASDTAASADAASASAPADGASAISASEEPASSASGAEAAASDASDGAPVKKKKTRLTKIKIEPVKQLEPAS